MKDNAPVVSTKYILEKGRLEIVKRNYGYQVPAQATIRTMKWYQVAISDSVVALQQIIKPCVGFRWRIRNWDNLDIVFENQQGDIQKQ